MRSREAKAKFPEVWRAAMREAARACERLAARKVQAIKYGRTWRREHRMRGSSGYGRAQRGKATGMEMCAELLRLMAKDQK